MFPEPLATRTARSARWRERWCAACPPFTSQREAGTFLGYPPTGACMRTVFATFVLVSLSVIGTGCRDSNVGGTDQGVFTFHPKVGTSYTRTARWTREIALVGTPLRRTEVT